MTARHARTLRTTCRTGFRLRSRVDNHGKMEAMLTRIVKHSAAYRTCRKLSLPSISPFDYQLAMHRLARLSRAAEQAHFLTWCASPAARGSLPNAGKQTLFSTGLLFATAAAISAQDDRIVQYSKNLNADMIGSIAVLHHSSCPSPISTASLPGGRLVTCYANCRPATASSRYFGSISALFRGKLPLRRFATDRRQCCSRRQAARRFRQSAKLDIMCALRHISRPTVARAVKRYARARRRRLFRAAPGAWCVQVV